MITKKVVLPALTAALILTQMYGCSGLSDKELVELVNSEDNIVLEIKAPSTYDVAKLKAGSTEQTLRWLQLDQKKEYNIELRLDFDKTFNINNVTQNGINGKSGSLYVDKDNDRNGNTSLADAFRNKVFVEKYWSDQKVQNSLSELGRKVFSDLGTSSGVMASLNAYYGLLPNYENPNTYYGTNPITREQFFALMFKSENGVVDTLVEDNDFNQLMGGQSAYTKFAKESIPYSFLKVENLSLDKDTYKGYITKGEVMYSLINKAFEDKLKNYQAPEKAFKNIKNAGDIASELKFEKDTRKDKFVLAFMLKHPDEGVDNAMYKALAYAKEQGIIHDEFKWGEVVSKEEALKMVVDVQLAKNKVYGYVSTVEYGTENKEKSAVELDPDGAIGVDENGAAYGKDWAEDKNGITELKADSVVGNGVTAKELQGIIKGFEKAGEDKEFIELYINTYYPGVDVDTIKEVGKNEVKKPTKKPGTVVKKDENDKKPSGNKDNDKVNKPSQNVNVAKPKPEKPASNVSKPSNNSKPDNVTKPKPKPENNDNKKPSNSQSKYNTGDKELDAWLNSTKTSNEVMANGNAVDASSSGVGGLKPAGAK